MAPRTFTFASLTLLAAAAGCGSSIIGGNTGGSGGGDTTTTATSSSSGVMTASSSSGGASSSSGGASSSSGGSTSSSSGAHPPPPGPAATPDGAGSAVFAIHKLFIGDTDWDGTPNVANAWKQYGYDLDGKISTLASTDLCKPRDNAPPKQVYPDGNDGIDNAFGKSILPILLGLSSNFSAQVNQAVAQGHDTLLFDLPGLGAGASYNPILSRVYHAAPLAQPPAWNGSDVRPVTYESLASPSDLTSATLQTAQAYVVNNTWVAPLAGDLMLKLEITGLPLQVPIHNPVITMALDAVHQSGSHGIIAGVVPAEKFATAIKMLAGTFDPSLCGGATIDSIAAQIMQTADILIDGSQSPLATCDGISIGIGFEATAVNLGAVAAPVPPLADPCAVP